MMEPAKPGWWRFGAASAALAAIFWRGANCSEVNCTSLDRQNGSFIVTSQAAADALSNCSTITGNVIIQSNTLAQIILNGIEVIQGNLATSSCDELQIIKAPILSQITNNFTLSDLPLLASLRFPLLDNINGGLYWDMLPELADVEFGNLTANPHGLPGVNVDGDISISSTGLSSLAFLNFTHYSNPAMIWIKENQQLSNINLTGLSWGSNSLAIVDNALLAQVLLPDLKSGGAIAIGNVGHIDISSLSQISGDLEISNNSISIFSAPNLTSLDGNLVVRNNYLLADLNLPLLSAIGNEPAQGNFVVANNSALNTITNMSQLLYTQGNISISGNLSNVILPHLRSVNGGFHLESANPALDCTAFDILANQNDWSPSFYSCNAYLPGGIEDLAKHYHAPKGLQLSKPSKAIIVIISVVAGILLCALLMRYFGQKRLRQGSIAEESIDLGDVGVTRTRSGGRDSLSEGDRPPEYRKVGKPGEVPPGYAENGNGGEHLTEAESQTTPIEIHESSGDRTT